MKEGKVKRFVRNWLLPPGPYSVLRGFVPGSNIPASVSQDDPLTSAGRKLKDIHLGEDCFILGSGSSVLKQDIKRLAGKNVISVSNSYVHPDFALFRPRYHVLPPILSSHARVYDETRFHSWFREMDERLLDAEIFLHIGDKPLAERAGAFGKRKIHWVDYVPWNEDFNKPVELGKIPSIWSVSELAITLAVHLGFDRIYLLGFDHDWFRGIFNYFFDEKTEHKVKPDASQLGFADSEYQMRRHAYIFRKYKYLYSIKKNIFNANADPNSYVDVFPKVSFESLVL